MTIPVIQFTDCGVFKWDGVIYVVKREEPLYRGIHLKTKKYINRPFSYDSDKDLIPNKKTPKAIAAKSMRVLNSFFRKRNSKFPSQKVYKKGMCSKSEA